MRAIGIDINSHSVKLVELVKTGSGIELTDFSISEIGDDVEKNVTEIFRNKKLTGKDIIVSSVPASSIILRELTFPFYDAQKISRIIRFEAEPFLPFPIGEALTGFYPISRQGTSSLPYRILLCAADSRVVQARLMLFEKSPVKPTILLPDCFALFNLASYAGVSESIVVHSGQDISICVVKGGRLSSVRGLREVSRLERELEFTLNGLAVLGESPPAEILLLGEGKKLSGILQSVSAKFNIKLREADFAGRIINRLQGREPADIMQSAPVSVGLALAGLGLVNGKMDNVNLLKTAGNSSSPFKKAIVTMIAICLVLVLTGIAGVSFKLLSGKRRLLAIEGKIRDAFYQVFPEESNRKRTIIEMRGMMKGRVGRGEARKGAFLKISPLNALCEISARIPDKISVELTDFSLNGSSLSIQGQTDNSENVDIIKQELERSSYFKTVVIRDATTDSARNKIKFVIEIAL